MPPPPTPVRSATRSSRRSVPAIIASIATRRQKVLWADVDVSGVGRRGVLRLSCRDRPARAVCAAGACRGAEPAFLPAADPAASGLYGLLLAAGGRVDRDFHRHGAGAAILHRVQPL